jgi:hypothetical protein
MLQIDEMPSSPLYTAKRDDDQPDETCQHSPQSLRPLRHHTTPHTHRTCSAPLAPHHTTNSLHSLLPLRHRTTPRTHHTTTPRSHRIRFAPSGTATPHHALTALAPPPLEPQHTTHSPHTLRPLRYRTTPRTHRTRSAPSGTTPHHACWLVLLTIV